MHSNNAKFGGARSNYGLCQRIKLRFDRHHAFDLLIHQLLVNQFACGFGHKVERLCDPLIPPKAQKTAQCRLSHKARFRRPHRPAIPAEILLAVGHKKSTRLQCLRGEG